MTNDTNKILIVDDEEDIVELIKYNLQKEGYDVATASNGLVAIQTAEAFAPQLILLDVMMPELDGIEVCEKLRAMPQFDQTIICFLSARGEAYTQVSAYERGADDFIAKPIKMNILVAKVKALLKRLRPQQDQEQAIQTLQWSNIVINIDEHTVTKAGTDIVLPRKEFELLALLMSKPSKVYKREEILQAIWGEDVIVGDRTIDVHIRKLREKLGDDIITTIKGVGYKLDVND